MNLYAYAQRIQLVLSVISVMTLSFFHIKLHGESCNTNNSEHHKVTTITAKKLHQILFPDEDPLFRQYDVYVGNDITFICILSSEAYNNCHIPKSINIPLNQLHATVSSWHRGKEIVVYGNNSSDSRSAFAILTNMGFKKVHAYEGGMNEWKSMYPEHCEGRCAN